MYIYISFLYKIISIPIYSNNLVFVKKHEQKCHKCSKNLEIYIFFDLEERYEPRVNRQTFAQIL